MSIAPAVPQKDLPAGAKEPFAPAGFYLTQLLLYTSRAYGAQTRRLRIRLLSLVITRPVSSSSFHCLSHPNRSFSQNLRA